MEYVTENDEEYPEPVTGHGTRAVITPLLLVLYLVLFAVMCYKARVWNMSFGSFVMKPFGIGLLGKFGALLPDRAANQGEYFRYLTSAFVHINVIHLIFNGYCIFNLGKAIEYYYGARRMFLSFVICTISANAFLVAMSPEAQVHVGTLGGLFGLDGVLIGFALRNRSLLQKKVFKRMILGALFWPVLWIVLSLTIKQFRGGTEGLLAGFGAGIVMGSIFRAVRFRGGKGLSGLVTFLFIASLALCAAGWLNLLGATESVAIRPVMKNHICEEGGFEIPVPDDMTPECRDDELLIGKRGWTFCRVAWREKGPYDELDSLVRQVIFDRSLESDRDEDVQDVHLVERKDCSRVGAEGTFFVLSLNLKGDEMFFAQAILIKKELIYTITFYYPAQDEMRQAQVDIMTEGFEFTGPTGD